MTRRHLITRTAATGVVLSGSLVFVSLFGPRPTPVHAEIYAPLAAATGFMALPGGEGTKVRNGKVLVNGVAFNYVVGHSPLSLDAVLSHYEKQFETRDESGTKLASGTRLQVNGAGAVAGLRFGKMVQVSDAVNRAAAFASTGRLSALGDFHLISAYSQRGTVFIDFTPGENVTVASLLPQGTADAPGEDLAGVHRPAGLQRLLTIEHGNEGDWSRTLIYRARDARGTFGAFQRALMAGGWIRNPVVQSPDVVHFADATRECFLATAAGSGGDATVILVHRRLAN